MFFLFFILLLIVYIYVLFYKDKDKDQIEYKVYSDGCLRLNSILNRIRSWKLLVHPQIQNRTNQPTLFYFARVDRKSSSLFVLQSPLRHFQVNPNSCILRLSIIILFPHHVLVQYPIYLWCCLNKLGHRVVSCFLPNELPCSLCVCPWFIYYYFFKITIWLVIN